MKKKSIEEIVKIIYKNNLDLSLKFIIDTLEAKAEIEEGFGEEYQFGVLNETRTPSSSFESSILHSITKDE